MESYAAIDVSLEGRSVCVVDAAGQIVREAKVQIGPGSIFFETLLAGLDGRATTMRKALSL